MDQSISCLGERGTARYISFHPLRSEVVELPEGVTFVMANSMAKAEKAVTAATQYNCRVVECILSTKLMAKTLGLSNWDDITIFQDLQKAYSEKTGKDTSLEEMDKLVKENLHEEPYTTDELLKLFGTDSLRSLVSFRGQAAFDVLDVNDTFKLWHRARHVYSESARVEEFRFEKDSAKLGALMNASQDSCANLFECSCSELDELTALCRSLGAIGSRLTGAGWGGCTVSLVKADEAEAFVDALKAKHYQGVEKVEEKVFATAPGIGAVVLRQAQP